MSPSSAVQHARLYGRHHPYACQSRLADLATGGAFTNRTELTVLRAYHGSMAPDMTDSTSDTVTNSEQLIIDVTLHPGDVLIIPPFWLHEVSVCLLS